ncbi:MAG: hypothetical protein R6X14_02470 [bacterium]
MSITESWFSSVCNCSSCSSCFSFSFRFSSSTDAGLRIIDIANPLDPYEAGSYPIPGYAFDVATGGNLAFVAAGNAGLRVIAVGDPGKPYEAGYYDTPGYASSVALDNNYALVADGDAGLRIIEFYGAGVEEGSTPPAARRGPGQTIVRDNLVLPGSPSASHYSLLDHTGRKVTELAPGNNDVRHLAPGVYFVLGSFATEVSLQQHGAQGKERSPNRDFVRRVVIQR